MPSRAQRMSILADALILISGAEARSPASVRRPARGHTGRTAPQRTSGGTETPIRAGTPLTMGGDGFLRALVDYAPRPPLHYNCRSMLLAPTDMARAPSETVVIGPGRGGNSPAMLQRFRHMFDIGRAMDEAAVATGAAADAMRQMGSAIDMARNPVDIVAQAVEFCADKSRWIAPAAALEMAVGAAEGRTKDDM